MFGFLKNLLSKRGVESPPPSAAPATPAVAEGPPSAAVTAAPPRSAPVSKPAVSAAPLPPSGDTISLPLHTVVSRLPQGLRAKVSQPPDPAIQLTVPLHKVLSQLGSGVVKISFGELRLLSPPEIFARAIGDDHALVELPLQEILARVRPEQLHRRPEQKRIEVPGDVTEVFGPRGVLSPVAPVAPEAPAARPSPPAVELRRPAPVAAPLPMPQRAVEPPRPAAVAPVSAAPPVAGLVSVPGCLAVPLRSLIDAWPAPAQEQLAMLAGAGTVVAIPLEVAEEGLKRGKVAPTWKQLRAWLQPPPAAVVAPALADDTVLELSLNVLAPLFLSQRKAASAPRKLAVPEHIPALFTGKTSALPTLPVPTAAPVPAKAAPPAPVVAPAPVPAAVAPIPFAPPVGPFPAAPAAPAKPAATAAEFIAQLGKKKWTPTELVQKTASLPGVAGAVITLPEGLQVASQLPPALNGDAIAAFIPQMFARNLQYVKEFQLGEPKQLTLVIESVPVAVFKTGNLYFAVLGRAGEPLPQAQLQAVAAQLAR